MATTASTYPNPDFSNSDLVKEAGRFGEIDPTDPGFEKALAACEDSFANLPPSAANPAAYR